MSKLPAIQFYPGDWRKDVGVQSLSFHDRGVWFEMLMLMHESEVRGKLMLGGKVITDALLADILHIDKEVMAATIETLIERGVTEREKRTGALINRRMLRDDILRSETREKVETWRKSKKSKENGNDFVTPVLPQTNDDVTPVSPLSSASSSSSVTSSIQKQKQVQKPSESPDGDRGKSKPPKEVDPRHTPFRSAFEAYFLHKNPTLREAPWDGREAGALAKFLARSPSFTEEQWRILLRNRARSQVPHGEVLSAWIERALTWASGATNAYGKPQEGGNGSNREQEIIDSGQRVLDERRRARRLADDEDRDRGTAETGGTGAERGGEGVASGLVLGAV